MKKSYKSGAKTLLLATAFTAGSILCGASTGLAVDTVDTVDTSADALMARQLQLEGTRLQLKGDLAGALEKYQQSIKLQPNPRLEKISQRIAEKENKSDAPAEVVVEKVVAPVAPTVEEVAVPAEPETVVPPVEPSINSLPEALEVPAAAA